MSDLGQEVAYLDRPEFRAFWAADASRLRMRWAIGKVEG
jgi:hypothetical protein